MAELTDEQKEFVIEQLATFRSPSAVRDALKAEFKNDVTLRQLAYYNPTGLYGRKLAEKWKTLFAEIRDAFIADRKSIAISHASFRQRRRQELLEMELVAANPVLTLEILEAAAKEEGGLFTQRGVSPQAAIGFVQQIAQTVDTALRKHVPDEGQRAAVSGAVTKFLEETGVAGGD